ncbi:hypothetical protein PF010_g21876 [Phytophthora fragariae]|uniref:Uncharacterized protein n=1 Tax=Phytophthora fragariae TaxID=53985 RepID=A0A6A4BWH3_9STRA|nr:hypothetical protein PF009_g25808 [Phytophthora fragariae]KAE9075807.1 hypothetical protein PF007_g24861 [Phytophthora fragariae]KAE9081735.1 hypothetical protein PF010_g21876 [Phytophthora fragariae]KAE9094900.1 hypothetical protein PF006_g24114 [Phytophthora fragariae]KAE9280780.1 hypothetical protein PF001_g24076 [Phytophthora fragariae]
MASLYVAPCTDVAADDGLPTAIMNVNSEKHAVKWDSCARYSVAGSEWMQRGERVRGPVPVDYVEGVGGFLYDVLGLWTFYMRSVFGQVAQVTVCSVEGYTSEFIRAYSPMTLRVLPHPLASYAKSSASASPCE